MSVQQTEERTELKSLENQNLKDTNTNGVVNQGAEKANTERPLSEQEKALRLKVMKFLGLVEENPPKVEVANDVESEDDNDGDVEQAEEENHPTENQDGAHNSISPAEASNHKVTTANASDDKSNQNTQPETKATTKSTSAYESMITFPPEEEKKPYHNADTEISTKKDQGDADSKKKSGGKDWKSLLSQAVGKLSNTLSKLNPYSGMGNFNPDEHFSSVPEICDIESVADKVVLKSNIVVFTGPGISIGSGLPDFAVDQPYWTLKNGQDKIEFSRLLTKKFFNEKPEEVWRWHSQFRKMVINSAPNDAHYTLADTLSMCNDIGIKFTLITENIDNFHVDSYIRAESKSKKNYFEETKGGGTIMDEKSENYGFCKAVFEINGNINYMRCWRNCCKKLFSTPLGTSEYFVPECPECKGIARPHSKFNDEDPDDYFFKKNIVQSKITYCDCVILVGTRLESSVANTLINQAITSGALIVEVGASPVLEFGNIKQLIGMPEELVPMLCQAIRERLSKFGPKPKP